MTPPALTVDEQRALLAAVRQGNSAEGAGAALGLPAGAVERAVAMDPLLARSLGAAADPALRRGRWRCPGHHCGSLTGYHYGCRLSWCVAQVAPQKEERRRAAGSRPSSTRITGEMRTVILTLLRSGATIGAAAEAAGTNPDRIRMLRHADADFDSEVLAARGSTARLRKTFTCPGPDCGTSNGAAYGCTQQACREAATAKARAVQARAFRAAQRLLGEEDKRRYLDLIEAGTPLTQAARHLGWSPGTFEYARRDEPVFDRQVVAAAERARDAGAASAKSHPRLVHRVEARTGT